MNVDSIAIIDKLYKSDATRDAVVAAASSAADRYNKAAKDAATLASPKRGDAAPARGESATPATSGSNGNGPYEQAKHALDDLHLPVGWDNARFSIHRADWPRSQDQWLKYFFFPWIGWILTALAASLGAPFWFDVLNKFMVIRSTVKPHEKSPEESSEDRQQQPGGTTVVVNPGGGTAPPSPSGAGLGAGNAAPDQEADGCDVLQTSALNLTDDSQLPMPQGGVA
jgi:hypothetical protein